jgi:hypothetical protein
MRRLITYAWVSCPAIMKHRFDGLHQEFASSFLNVCDVGSFLTDVAHHLFGNLTSFSRKE